MTETVQEHYTEQDLQDMLPIYYKRLFPHKNFYRWLSYGEGKRQYPEPKNLLLESKTVCNFSDGNPTIFTHREFSITLMDDVYIRYLSYEKQSDLELDLCTRNPFKIDIGPVMSARPKDHRITNSMQPVQRELIFDIDMTDYDDVRSCCSGAEICQKCWKFMVVACHIIDAALRGEFTHRN